MFKKIITFSFLLSASVFTQAEYRITYKTNILKIPEQTFLEELESEVMNLSPDAWYQMSDANVTNGKIISVPDKSGNGHLLYSNSGQELDYIPDFINGYPVAYSNSDRFYTQLSSKNASDIVYFSVAKRKNSSSKIYPFSNYFSSSGMFTTINNAHGRPSGRSTTGGYYNTSSQSIDANKFNISGVRAGSYYMTHFLNNNYSNTINTRGPLVIKTNRTEIMGAANYTNTTSNLQSNAYGAEFILFNKKLTAEEITLVHDYLNEKYNIY